MPTLTVGWRNLVPYINTLVQSVDNVILSGTDNVYNFESLFQSGFPIGVDSNYPPPDPTKDVISFGRLIFNNILNGGLQHPFTKPLLPKDMRSKINLLLQSPELQKFQQVKQSGSQLGNIRGLLLTMLNSIPNV